MASDTADEANAPALRSLWESRAPDESESEDEESDPSSIADVFAEMLNVNEDMIRAAADCHADNDIDGTLAYQRILHRNLMEMANYIDSMFGVYGSQPPAAGSLALTARSSASSSSSKSKRKSDNSASVRSRVSENADTSAPRAPLTPEEMFELFSKALAKMPAPAPPSSSHADSESSALLETLEADEHLRGLKRSNKLRIKSQHLVREEESVSAIMNATAEKIAAIAVDARDSVMQQRQEEEDEGEDDGGCDEENDDEDEDDEEEDDAEEEEDEDADDNDAPDSPPDPATARQVAGSARATRVPRPTRAARAAHPPPEKVALAAAPPAPAPDMAGAHSQLNVMSLMNLLAPDLLQLQAPALGMLLPPMLPPALPPFLAPPQLDPATMAAMGMSWGPVLRPETGKRQAMPPTWGFSAAAAAAQKKAFGRVCAECQKLHYSLHKCRVLLRHTAPEWGTRRKRKQGEAKSGEA